ncbi:MAG: SusC/RagA family TonB-linked outer membrane protein [Marinifilaceae bacterium]
MKKQANDVIRLDEITFKKTFRALKSFLIIMFLGSMQLSANVYLNDQRVTFNLKSVTLDEVMNEISNQTDYEFLYNQSIMEDEKILDLHVENKLVKYVLDMVSVQNTLEYQINNNFIVIRKKSDQQSVQQKKITLSGVVKDIDGESLPGVSVFIDGTKYGVSTDMDGKYIIEFLNAGKVKITFSFVGMITQVVKYTGQKNMNIILENDSENLEDIIVTGYQKIDRKRMTGAVKVIQADKIANSGFVSVDQAIQGQISGVSSMKISGRPGASTQIRIRGMNTLTGDSNPIWIVDGMPMQGATPRIGAGGSDFTNSVLTNGIGNIAVEDIASITVLKDAAASTIYGARAANGVIVITTKRGRVGKSYLNIRSSFSINEAPKQNLDLMNSKQKIAFETSLYNDYPHLDIKGRVFQLLKKKDAGIYSQDYVNSQLAILGNTNTNWFKEMFRTSYAVNEAISLQGGDEKTQFYGSLNYQNESGIVLNNEYNNYGGALKLTHNFNKKLRINFDLNLNMKEDKSTASRINPLGYATYANPYESVYDINGHLSYDRSYESALSKINPGYKYNLNVIDDIKNNTTNGNYLNAALNVKLEYEIIKGFMFESQGAFGNTYSNSRTILSPRTYSSYKNSWISSIYKTGEIPNDLNNGSLEESNSRSLNYTWRNTLAFNKYLTKDHFINVMAGQEMTNNETRSFNSRSTEYDPVYDLVGSPDLTGVEANKLDIKGLGGTRTNRNRTVSFFATGTYSYKDKYVLSTSGRFDGVDIVGTNNRFTPLWNISFKYNLHRESFIKDIVWINQLSIRSSYGYTGSIDYNARPFPILQFYYSSRRRGDVLLPSNITSANPSIKWQKKQDRSIGMDFSLFDNRFSGDINYYNNKSTDLLDTKRIAISSGRSKIKANVASIMNEGLELSFNTLNIRTNNFRWTTNFNITFNKNKVIETYYKGLKYLPTITRGSYNQRYFINDYPTQAWYGYHFAGVDPTNGHTLAYIDKKDDNGKSVGHKLKNGKYVIDMDTEFRKDAVDFLGESYPTFTGGFGTGIYYKGLNISAMFTYMGGHKIASASINSNPLYASRTNLSRQEMNRWRKNGDITDVAAYSNNSENARNRYFFDNQLEDGSFLKLSNISVSYNIPPVFCQKLNLIKLQLSFNASNLYTWTKYKGIDPETMGAFGYPSARRYSFNLNIGI